MSTEWVYQQTEPGLYTVGFYSPDGSWHTDGDYSKAEAAKRAAYLNGAAQEIAFEGWVLRLYEEDGTLVKELPVEHADIYLRATPLGDEPGLAPWYQTIIRSAHEESWGDTPIPDGGHAVICPKPAYEAQMLGTIIHMVGHLPICIRLQREWALARGLWWQAWPNACEECEGKGIRAYTENLAGRGDPPIMESFEEPCPSCLEQDRCPRCGRLMGLNGAEEDAKPCSDCGWAWGKGPDDICPPAWEGCLCGDNIEIEEVDWEPLAELETCPDCHGDGDVPCPTCGDRGEV